FGAVGLKRAHWSSATPMRAIFRAAFAAVGLPYFNPHSFRTTLVRLGEGVCRTPEEFKAWSQNLGHESVMTTFRNYGTVDPRRQSEIMKRFGEPTEAGDADVDKLAAAVARNLLRGSQSGGSEERTQNCEA
ncbi:MAG: site-specific integrase, partial [Gemmatimonadaceae bacterium]